MSAPALTPFAHEDPATARILTAAHQHLFAEGYTALTMDALAHELGMSKKTLYVYFPGKDALIERIIDCVSRSLRTRLEAVFSDASLSFPERVQAVSAAVGSILARTSPVMFRELQRFAPKIYEKIEEMRQKNVPYAFGRLVREGIAAGKVRPDIDPAFATEFWLQAIRGLMQPEVLDRTQLTPRQTLEKGLNLFLSGLLTPAGRKDYEKLLAS